MCLRHEANCISVVLADPVRSAIRVLGLSIVGAGQRHQPLIGITMPTVSLERWNNDGAGLKAQLESMGYQTMLDFTIFVHMGLLAAVAAVVVTSRANAATSTAGQSYELDAIAACFIGGTAVTGGVGRISGAMVGALIMGVLNMGLSITGVGSAWQQVVKGLVLLAAVAFDLLSKRRTKVS